MAWSMPRGEQSTRNLPSDKGKLPGIVGEKPRRVSQAEPSPRRQEVGLTCDCQVPEPTSSLCEKVRSSGDCDGECVGL